MANLSGVEILLKSGLRKRIRTQKIAILKFRAATVFGDQTPGGNATDVRKTGGITLVRRYTH